jgi:hypothetical protein
MLGSENSNVDDDPRMINPARVMMAMLKGEP